MFVKVPEPLITNDPVIITFWFNGVTEEAMVANEAVP
jgi:hypothetical protein